MGNKLSQYSPFFTGFCPKLGKKYTKTTQNLHNLYKFIKLGCPDPTPSMYLMNLDSVMYSHAAVPIEIAKELEYSTYIENYNYWLPARPNSVAKITGL